MRSRPLVPALGAVVLAAAAPALAPGAGAQLPAGGYADAFDLRRARTDPALAYVVRVDPARPASYAVELTVRHAPDSVRLALARWAPGAYRLAEFGRYAHDVAATVDGRAAPVARDTTGGALAWIVRAPARAASTTGGGRTLRVTYEVRFPTPAAAATPNNRSFLTARGALFDGPLTYAFLPGLERLPAHVRFALPTGWRVVTGLVPTADPATFVAPSVDVLLDSPALAGPPEALRTWRFAVDGVPHTVAHWRQTGAPPFDTARFVAVADTVVRTARALMGELPYREYAFLYVDGGGGGLEHLNSTTIGAPSAALARDAASRASVTAHEHFHLWNVKRLRPAALGPFDYLRPVRAHTLWWSEGVTDFFADEILRRSGLTDSATAVQELADAVASALGNPAVTRISPERSSWTAWDRPDVHEGYTISYYLQGKLLGELLELALRDATDGRRGMDDVMRLLYDRHAGAAGFSGEDIARAADTVCGCDLDPVFDAHVRGTRPIDWNRWLAVAGWRLDSTRATVVDSAGRPRPDLRAGVTPFGGLGSAGGAAGTRPRLSLPDPRNAWYAAGLRAGDEVLGVDGRPVDDPAGWRDALAGARVGDTVSVEARRDGRPVRARVVLAPVEALRVRLVDVPTPTARQRRMRAIWLRGVEGGA